MRPDLSLASRLFRRLLVLYPAAFRARHADDMTQLFEDQVRDARRDGGPGRVGLTLARAVTDVVVTATGEHVRGGRTLAHSAEVAPAGWARAFGLAGVVGGLVLVAAFVPNLQMSSEFSNLRLVLFNVGAIAIVLAVHRRNARVSRRLSLAAAVPAIVANAWYLVMVVLSLGRPQLPAADPDFRLVMFAAGAAMWLSNAFFGLVTLRLRAAVSLGALALFAGSLLAFTGMDRLELVRGDAAWFFGPAALVGIALNGVAWILLGVDLAVRRTPDRNGGGPPMSRAVVGLVVVYALAFAGALAMLANPDPQRWVGWGPTGVALGLAVSIIGLLAALESRRAGLVVCLVGSAVAMAAMPWAFYLFVLAPAVLGYLVLGEQPAPVASEAAGSAP